MKFYYEKLRPLRDATGLRTKVFCEKLGISNTTLWHWEKGTKTPREEKIRLLSEILNVQVSEISDLSPQIQKSMHKLSDITQPWDNFERNEGEIILEQFNSIFHKLNRHYKLQKQHNIITKIIFSAINTIIYIKDTEQNYLLANNAFKKNLGLRNDFITKHKNDFDFLSTNEAKINVNADNKVLTTGTPSINIEEYIPGSRKKRFGLISRIPIFDANKNIAGVIGIIHDITDKKQKEETYKLLENALNKSSDVLCSRHHINSSLFPKQ